MSRSKEISLDAFREIIAPLGLSMKPQDEVEYFTLHSLVQQSIGAVAQLPEYVDPQLKPDLGPDPVPRTYEEPAAAENPLNAWRHRVSYLPFEAQKDDILNDRCRHTSSRQTRHQRAASWQARR